MTRRVPRQPPDPETLRRRRELGRRLRELRERAGLSQEKAAEAAGMERSFWAKLEGGQHSVLLDRVWDLARAVHADPADLFRPGGDTD